MYRFVNTLSRNVKRYILLTVDVFLVPVALFLGLALQQSGFPNLDVFAGRWLSLPLLMGLSGLVSTAMGINKIQLKAYETRAIGMTGAHAVLLGLATAVLDDLAGFGTPVATFINFALVYFLLSVAARVIMLQILLAIYRNGQEQCRVLIYGAGATGRQLAAALRTDETIFPIAFIDDNSALNAIMMQGLRVYPARDIERLMKERQIDRVLIAMPQMPRAQLAQLSKRLKNMGLDVQALPSFSQLAAQGSLVDQLQAVVPGRFLGRAPLDDEMPGRSEYYADRSILITGAGGSIGSELCRQVLACRARRLVLLEISELALYTIDLELRTLTEDLNIEIIPVLGSITDPALMRRTMANYDIQVVLHAAAYKHVPLVEQNAIVGISNNVLGTQTLATAAAAANVERFILISSDKAVRPKNIMGASKRLAEIVVQDLASRAGTGTIFTMVRFGNVIGSSGSVIPLFRDQIEKGGPVTLTHEDVTRYFMTISEAARLVLVAGFFASGGDVFVLDMGKPILIKNLVRQMVEAAGSKIKDANNPDGDIEVVITGLRPGEKIHEELLIGEGQLTTAHSKIMQAREVHLSQADVATALQGLRDAIEEADVVALRKVVNRFVEGEDLLHGDISQE